MNYKILFFTFLLCLGLKAQDTIVKKNGTIIPAKILEVGTNAVSYKKTSYLDGPTIIMNKSEIVYIKYKDGQIEEFLDTQETDLKKAMLDTAKTSKDIGKNNSTNSQTSRDDNTSSSKNKIEFLDGKYAINGRKASRKDVTRLLETSKNPAITLPLKAAKTTGTFQKIVKITSIPTTIGGGGAFLWTGIDMYNDIKRGRDNTGTYVSAFSSLLTTLTFPITGKILKNKTEKMYNALIDVYNLTN